MIGGLLGKALGFSDRSGEGLSLGVRLGASDGSDDGSKLGS